MSDCFIGEIRMFGFSWAPKGWALCQGQVMNIQQNQALFALLGNTFGGNGQTTFGLPDLRGRVPLCIGQSPISGTVYDAGIKSAGGAENVTLTADQVPLHTHTVYALSTQGTVNSPIGALISSVKPAGTPSAAASIYGTADSSSDFRSLNSGTVSSVGGAPHDNMQPFTVTNFCIATAGFFPSRS